MKFRPSSTISIWQKAFIVLCCIFGASTSTWSQDPTFTQFYSNPVYLNPALAGTTGCPRFTLNYRNEWPQLTGNYVTYSAGYDSYVKDIKGGVALLAMYDQQAEGTISTTMLGGVYSYNLKVNRKVSVNFGVRAAYIQKYLDWDKLTFGDMIDPRRGFIYQTGDVPRGGKRGLFDASAGGVVFSKYFYGGIAVHHINQPDESMILGSSKLPARITAHMGGTIPIGRRGRYSDGTTIKPAVIYQYQNGFQEFNIGAYLNYERLNVGVWYRNKDAMVFIIGVKADQFRVGYSYDLTVSRLGNGLTGGSHEVSFQYDLKCRKKPKNFRKISCPSF
ncbi:MAG: type IX secretion system membrane protein PorP/SprF [Flavobacteriales bacterium]